MSKFVAVISAATLKALRRKAKELKKQCNIAHHEALEQVASITGHFSYWHQVVEAAKATELSERAFKNGLVVGLDPKEAGDIELNVLHGFVTDDRLSIFVVAELENERAQNRELAFDKDEYEELVYLRYIKLLPTNLEAALDICVESFFFSPRYTRFKGSVIEVVLQEEGDRE